MDVSVGSFSDPDGIEGLAHFLGECDDNAYDMLHFLLLVFDFASRRIVFYVNF